MFLDKKSRWFFAYGLIVLLCGVANFAFAPSEFLAVTSVFLYISTVILNKILILNELIYNFNAEKGSFSELLVNIVLPFWAPAISIFSPFLFVIYSTIFLVKTLLGKITN